MKKLSLCLVALVVSWTGAPLSVAQEEKPKGDPKVILKTLLKELDSEDAQARLEAITGLAEFGPDAAPAVPKLVKAIRESDEDVRLNAAITLGKIGKAAVAPLLELLGSQDEDTRFYSLWAM